MSRWLGAATIVAATFFPGSCVFAMARDETSLPGVTLIEVVAGDDAAAVRSAVGGLLDAGQRIVMAGDAQVLASMRLPFARVWPSGNTILLDPGAGLGIFGVDAHDAEARRRLVAAWPWVPDPAPPGRQVRAAPQIVGSRIVHVDFDVVAGSPSQMCRGFSATMMSRAFGERSPLPAERKAFRAELRRWCQYGNLSMHAAQVPHFTVGNYRESPVPRLSLTTEWALLRSEDRADETRTSYLFWARTMGDGAGTGFTREGGHRAWVDPVTHELREVMDAAIHSGWGDIESPDVITAWPANSSFPSTGDVFLYRCDGPELFRPANCPYLPTLRKLYPDDAYDGKVNLSAGESITYGGEIKLSRGLDSEGKVSSTISFGMQAMRSTTTTSQLDASLAQTRSNAGAVFYRSTWWTPDVYAIYRWLAGRTSAADITKATPLATTLNPRYEILWELPLRPNAGRVIPYHVVYEMGLNTCDRLLACTGPGNTLGERAKARVGWVDGITLFLPDA